MSTPGGFYLFTNTCHLPSVFVHNQIRTNWYAFVGYSFLIIIIVIIITFAQLQRNCSWNSASSWNSFFNGLVPWQLFKPEYSCSCIIDKCTNALPSSHSFLRTSSQCWSNKLTQSCGAHNDPMITMSHSCQRNTVFYYWIDIAPLQTAKVICAANH